MTYQEERLQFLNDTVVFFSKTSRAIQVNGLSRRPVYKTSKGICCAIGRHIPSERHPERLTGSPKNLFYGRIPVSIKDFVPNKIYLLGPNFLTMVGALHDTDSFWRKGGLTYDGQWHYMKIVNEYCGKFVSYENHF